MTNDRNDPLPQTMLRGRLLIRARVASAAAAMSSFFISVRVPRI